MFDSMAKRLGDWSVVYSAISCILPEYACPLGDVEPMRSITADGELTPPVALEIESVNTADVVKVVKKVANVCFPPVIKAVTISTIPTLVIVILGGPPSNLSHKNHYFRQ